MLLQQYGVYVALLKLHVFALTTLWYFASTYSGNIFTPHPIIAIMITIYSSILRLFEVFVCIYKFPLYTYNEIIHFSIKAQQFFESTHLIVFDSHIYQCSRLILYYLYSLKSFRHDIYHIL